MLRLAIVCLGILPLLGARADQQADLRRFEFTEPRLGTQVKLVIYSREVPTDLARQAFLRIDELNRILSDYDANSELTRLGRSSVSETVRVSNELAEVLGSAQEFAAASQGAFDVTVGPLTRLWRQARRQGRVPTTEAIQNARNRVDWRALEIKGNSVKLTRQDLQFDLGGLAKGYIAEQVWKVLRKSAPQSMVAIGGDLFLGDPPPAARGWSVEVAQGKANTDRTYVLLLHNCGISTAGDLEQFFEHQGRRYSHILDPRTGWGVTGSRLVTVVAPSGLLADGLDTTLAVLPTCEGLALMTKYPNAQARWVIPRESGPARIVETPGWKHLNRR